ncbi:MAG: hypothetical protein WC313_00860 [Candidatus Kapaibacterium sp.]
MKNKASGRKDSKGSFYCITVISGIWIYMKLLVFFEFSLRENYFKSYIKEGMKINQNIQT